MKPYHDPAEQIETEDIPPKEFYKGPITRSRIKTLEQNDSGALRYAGDRSLPECVIERRSGLTPGVMVWGGISYHGRSNLLRIDDNFNSSRYVREVLQMEVVPFLQGVPGSFIRIMHAPALQRLFDCSAQHMQLFLGLLIPRICRLLSTGWIWKVGVSLVIRVLQLQKTNFCCAYKQYGINSRLHADIQNPFDSMPSRIAVLIAERGVYTKY
ncbi:uncharacterized protein TNCV_955961 [Trichonephila clavipes]|nr:uncharacterized protein TNCV_955961 [Trichonephila clavipes]